MPKSILKELMDAAHDFGSSAYDEASLLGRGLASELLEGGADPEREARTRQALLDNMNRSALPYTAEDAAGLARASEQARSLIGAPARAIDRASMSFFDRPLIFSNEAAPEESMSPVIPGVSKSEADQAATQFNDLAAKVEAKKLEIANRQEEELKRRASDLQRASKTGTEAFVAKRNKIVRGDESKFTGPEQGSFSKVQASAPEDMLVRDLEKEGYPTEMARALARTRFAGASYSPAHYGFPEGAREAVKIPGTGRVFIDPESPDARIAQSRLEALEQGGSAQEDDIKLLREAMATKNPLETLQFVKMILRRKGRPEEYINALLGNSTEE